jgi:ribose 5-phosphate isomerase B
MRIAIGSDMANELTQFTLEWLGKNGHTSNSYGALVDPDALWAYTAIKVAEEVAKGSYDFGILFCWTGTGIALAANKVKGIRAALCHDAETVKGARKWNDANILAVSLRATSIPIMEEMLEVWFVTEVSQDEEDQKSLEFLEKYESDD